MIYLCSFAHQNVSFFLLNCYNHILCYWRWICFKKQIMYYLKRYAYIGRMNVIELLPTFNKKTECIWIETIEFKPVVLSMIYTLRDNVSKSHLKLENKWLLNLYIIVSHNSTCVVHESRIQDSVHYQNQIHRY